MDLFDYMRQNTMEKESPLASRLRPETLDEMDIINNVFDRIRSPQVVERASNLNF